MLLEATASLGAAEESGRGSMARHARRWDATAFVPYRPTRARTAVMLTGVLVAAAAYGLAGICGRLRMDIVRTGSCRVAKVTSVSKEYLTVEVEDGAHVGLYGHGLDVTAGTPVRVCVNKGGTWADARGDSSSWLLTSEPSIIPAAAAGILMILAFYAGDGIRIGHRDER